MLNINSINWGYYNLIYSMLVHYRRAWVCDVLWCSVGVLNGNGCFHLPGSASRMCWSLRLLLQSLQFVCMARSCKDVVLHVWQDMARPILVLIHCNKLFMNSWSCFLTDGFCFYKKMVLQQRAYYPTSLLISLNLGPWAFFGSRISMEAPCRCHLVPWAAEPPSE